MGDSDIEDYGFEYSDEDAEEENVDLENQYYNSKGLRESEPEAAILGFRQVVEMEGSEKGEWGFKALKQTVKTLFKIGRYSELLESYKLMLTYTKTAVTRNYSEKSLSKLLDVVSSSSDIEFLMSFYETTLEGLTDSKNERLWFKTNLKLCTLWQENKDFLKLGKLLKKLHKACQQEDGTDDPKKGSQLLEVYAIEIQMYTEQKDTKRLKQLYERSLKIQSAIAHPKIMGIIRECGGKMLMTEHKWEEAASDFFEAFKCYDEAGSPRRINSLKYLVLASMLRESKVDPFDSQEARPYKSDQEIQAMTSLMNAYQNNEIRKFEHLLKVHKVSIMDDPFIRNYIEDILRKIRKEVLLKLIKPYTRIRIPFISKQLNIAEADVEALLVSLILDKKVSGHIDQMKQLLELNPGKSSSDNERYNAMAKWTNQVRGISNAVTNRIIG